MSGKGNLQNDVARWMEHTFDRETIDSPIERGLRVLEEAAELAQSVGVDDTLAMRVLNDVYEREAGESAQEVAGVTICVAALANALEIDVDRAVREELARCGERSAEIAAKHALKQARGITSRSEA